MTASSEETWMADEIFAMEWATGRCKDMPQGQRTESLKAYMKEAFLAGVKNERERRPRR